MSIPLYLKEIGKYSILSAGEEQTATSDKLVLHNLKLVVAVAKQFRGRGLPFADLIQLGNLGLIKASKQFVPERKNRFTTFAVWLIRSSISRGIKQQSRSIALPANIWDKIYKLKKLRNELSEKQLLKFFSKKEQNYLDKVSSNIASLQKLVGENEETELQELLADASEGPEELTVNNLKKEEVSKLLEKLNPNEREIISLRFGLADGEIWSFPQIGKKLGKSKQAIHQRIPFILEKLKRLTQSGIV